MYHTAFWRGFCLFAKTPVSQSWEPLYCALRSLAIPEWNEIFKIKSTTALLRYGHSPLFPLYYLSLSHCLSFIENLLSPTSSCGSVDWTWACRLKGWQFDSQSGHMPGLWARSSVAGMQEANWSMFLSHIDVSLPLFLLLSPLSINK